MNIERQIKRHIIGPRHTFFAVTLPGFETVCRLELATLSNTIEIQETIRGGLLFSGRLTDLYLANLHLRTAGRILLRLTTFKATNFNRLIQEIRSVNWSLYLPAGVIPECKVASHHSRLYHSRAIGERVSQGIAQYWQGLQIPPGPTGEQTLYVRLVNDQVTLSLDSSGANLYQRGLKHHSAQAPLRETTAAAILLQAGYGPQMALADPMCGAGTFSLEAALMAKQIAPGQQREFAFMQWPAFKPRQWRHLKKMAAQKEQRSSGPTIQASDIDPQACAALDRCVQENGLADTVRVGRKDFFSLDRKALPVDPGLVVVNPPYGRRLTTAGDLKDFYRRLTDKLAHTFDGWRVALLAPKDVRVHLPGTRPDRHSLVHGGLSLNLWSGTLGKIGPTTKP